MLSYKTAESVCKGHPDKLCDIIADSILDECLRLDKSSRVACEVMATKGKIFICGEITCARKVNIKHIARKTLERIGYNPKKYRIYVAVHKQSADIASGIEKPFDSNEDVCNQLFSAIGAGDQGTVYGYATNETFERIPLPLVLAHEITKHLDEAMHTGAIHDIGPDGKAQVTVAYENHQPVKVKTIVVSVQHGKNKNIEDLKRDILFEIIYPMLERHHLPKDTDVLINPSGRFVKGGPDADTGLTGRKLMVDTYGGLALHGGGAFSGKDATKVDRSGAYMARAIAKNVVNAFLADECQVAISYAIGEAEPVAVEVDTFGTGRVSDEAIKKAILKVFDLRPAAIISLLGLKNIRYKDTAAYGHFDGYKGSWETLNRACELRKAAEQYEHRA